MEKSFFGQTEMEYLGFGVTCKGASPLNKKVEAITNMIPSTSNTGVRAFMVSIN